MLTVMIFVFLIGYLCIALEHPLKVNKAGTALLTGTILWVLYTFAAPDLIPTASDIGYGGILKQREIGRAHV